MDATRFRTRSEPMTRVALAGLVALLIAWSPPRPATPAPPPAAAEDRPTPQQVFERRILPIFKSPDPSSCVQCHLSGVDLKNYILPSHEKTFVSLRDQGLIDLDRPDQSKILRLIKMGEEDRKGAALIRAIRRYSCFQTLIRVRIAPQRGTKEFSFVCTKRLQS